MRKSMKGNRPIKWALRDWCGVVLRGRGTSFSGEIWRCLASQGQVRALGNAEKDTIERGIFHMSTVSPRTSHDCGIVLCLCPTKRFVSCCVGS